MWVRNRRKGLKMRCKAIFFQAGLLTVLFTFSGCFSSRPEDIEAFLKPFEADVTAEEYILQPPDEIEIHCSKVPEIDQQRQRIRPDGKVSFEALGEIEAAGKTCKQLADALTERVSTLYTLVGDEPIEVRIMAFLSKSFYVLGQVYTPGLKLYTGRDSVLSAIAEARLNPMAWVERIQVIRPSSDESVKSKIFEVDFNRMIVHGDLSKNVLLQEGDIIYVPPTVLSAVAMKVEEVVRPIARAFAGINVVQSGGQRQVGGYGGGYGGGGGYR